MSDSRLRVDLLLVQRKLVESRSKAQNLIERGQVFFGPENARQKVEKVSLELPISAEIFIAASTEDRFVSRAGLKLEKALERTQLDVSGYVVVDVGQSTGGFSECLLARGVARVIGLDVGHGQLHPRVRQDPRNLSFEGVNARDQQQLQSVRNHLPTVGADLLVIDLSFISLTLVLESVSSLAALGGSLLALVKPQFEVGPAHLGKGGIVKDASLFPQVENKIRAAAEKAGWVVEDYFESGWPGKDGNREFFLHGTKS